MSIMLNVICMLKASRLKHADTKMHIVCTSTSFFNWEFSTCILVYSFSMKSRHGCTTKPGNGNPESGGMFISYKEESPATCARTCNAFLTNPRSCCRWFLLYVPVLRLLIVNSHRCSSRQQSAIVHSTRPNARNHPLKPAQCEQLSCVRNHPLIHHTVYNDTALFPHTNSNVWYNTEAKLQC